jgi:hypothetical protein
MVRTLRAGIAGGIRAGDEHPRDLSSWRGIRLRRNNPYAMLTIAAPRPRHTHPPDRITAADVHHRHLPPR